MYTARHSLAFLLPIVFMFIILPMEAQVAPDFTMNKSSGCPPLIVQFTNQSSGSGNLTYTWKFGDGGTSDETHPGKTYPNPGNYTVTLIVTNGSSTDSLKKNIIVHQPPTANFESIRKGCAPLKVSFTDLSQKGSSNIVSWRWDLRTGDILSEQNPEFTYNFTGQYDLFLEVTDENLCKASIDRPDYIDVASWPVSSFSASPSVACEIPALISFTNSSTGPGALNYEWNFGDGANSTAKDPINTYANFGSYPVQLIVNSDYQCADTSKLNVYVQDVVAEGILMQDGVPINDGASICPGELKYEATTPGASNVRWVFSTEGISTLTEGTFLAQKAGSYRVLLIVEPQTPCADTLVWNLIVDNVKANFTQPADNSCQSPLDVTFTNTSTNFQSSLWKYNNGLSSNGTNGQTTYMVPEKTDPYAINEPVVFNTQLIVTSPMGCTSSITKSIIIKKPTAVFTSTKTSGCIPLNVSFTDQSLSDQKIVEWKWLTGIDEVSTGAVDSLNYSYTTDGDYSARLVITNQLGCSDTSYSIHIEAGKTLLPDFTSSSSTFCQGDEITFHDRTPEKELIDGWRYFVNDIPVETAVSDSSPVWRAVADTGKLDVKLSVNYNGCISHIVKPAFIEQSGTVADFTYTIDCATPFEVNYLNRGKNFDTFEWFYGDMTSNNSTSNPLKTYAGENNYQVMFITHKGACSDTIEKTIMVRQPNAQLLADTISCAGSETVYSAFGSFTGPVDYCHERFLWLPGSGYRPQRTFNDSLLYQINERGIHEVKVVAFYDNGCADTATHSLRLYQPFAGFMADTLYGCSPFDVVFTDTSTADFHPISQWTWDFSDGNDTTYTTKANTVLNRFENPGEFIVHLGINDTLGCSANAYTTVLTANPNAEFFAHDPTLCLGDSIHFGYNYTNGDSLIWTFGDGIVSTDTSNPIAYKYQQQGAYQVSLSIYKHGCKATYQTDSAFVQIQKANAQFNLSDSVWNCYPREITFTHSDTAGQVASGIWRFGYGNSLSDYAPQRQFNYPVPGNYLTSLSITTSFGCHDSVSRNINISGPLGSFDMAPGEACKYDIITLSIKDTSDIYAFEWDMDDGRIISGNPIEYQYKTVGKFYPKLILYGDSGICIPPPVVDTLLIYNVVADFDIADSALCSNYQLQFVNNSQENTYNYWNFGNGETATDAEPSAVFSDGIYTITLQVENDKQCKDTLQKSITIHARPSISLSNDTVACEGGTVQLYADGGDEIIWMPATYLNNQSIYHPVSTPTSTIRYVATVTDTSTHCQQSDSVQVGVQLYPSATLSPTSDTTVGVGEMVYVLIDSTGDYRYTWTPGEGVNCVHCASPVLRPIHSTSYTLTVADTNGCFEINLPLRVDVIEEYRIELPTTFSPTGDEGDRVIRVRGWGIDELIEFRIYNRWGEEVFATDDLTQGWDGYYKGKLQNIDTYAYAVKALMVNGVEMTKTGTFTLLK